MTTNLGAEGDHTLFDLLFSRPIGFLVSLVYLAQAVAPGADAIHPSGDITSLLANYVFPIALVVYFLVRDDRREKRNANEDAKRQKIEQERYAALQDESKKREDRMAKRIDELENYINTTMNKALTESSRNVGSLVEKIGEMLIVIKQDKEKE